MTDDATLSDFSRDDTQDGSGDESDRDSELSTYAWGAYTCSACDSSTDRVWRMDGELVCETCKEW